MILELASLIIYEQIMYQWFPSKVGLGGTQVCFKISTFKFSVGFDAPLKWWTFKTVGGRIDKLNHLVVIRVLDAPTVHITKRLHGLYKAF